MRYLTMLFKRLLVMLGIHGKAHKRAEDKHMQELHKTMGIGE